VLFFLAKALQAIGVIDVGIGLYLGISGQASLYRELEFAVTGLAIFYVGRWLERRA
jgi:hypothetical protein